METQKEMLKKQIDGLNAKIQELDERCKNVEEQLNSMSLYEICEEMKKGDRENFPVNRIEFYTAQVKDGEIEPHISLIIILENEKTIWRTVGNYTEI